MVFLRGLDRVYTAIMLTFWYGLFYGVWVMGAAAIAVLWRRGVFG